MLSFPSSDLLDSRPLTCASLAQSRTILIFAASFYPRRASCNLHFFLDLRARLLVIYTGANVVQISIVLESGIVQISSLLLKRSWSLFALGNLCTTVPQIRNSRIGSLANISVFPKAYRAKAD